MSDRFPNGGFKARPMHAIDSEGRLVRVETVAEDHDALKIGRYIVEPGNCIQYLSNSNLVVLRAAEFRPPTSFRGLSEAGRISGDLYTICLSDMVVGVQQQAVGIDLPLHGVGVCDSLLRVGQDGPEISYLQSAAGPSKTKGRMPKPTSPIRMISCPDLYQ